MPCESVKIIDPIDGAILNHHNGKQDPKGLKIVVRGIAPVGSKVAVNDFEAKFERESSREYGEFTCNIVLKEKENRIVACVQNGEKISEDAITVLWDRNSIKQYRL